MNFIENFKISIENYLTEIDLLRNEFDQLKQNPGLFIYDYFLNLRTNIDLYAEEAIYAIQTTQSILIGELKTHEKECLNRSEDLNEKLIENIETVLNRNLFERKLLIDQLTDKSQMNILKNSILTDKKSLISSVEKLKSDLIMERNFVFIQKSVKPPSYLFGDLILTNFFTDNCENDLFR